MWKSDDGEHYHRMRYPGEWMVISCTANVEENVTLWVKDRKLTTGNEKIKWVAQNIFIITNVTEEDEGKYNCEVCNQKREQNIILSVSNKGI